MDWKLVVPFWSVVVRLIFHGMESVGFKQQYMASGWSFQHKEYAPHLELSSQSG